VWADLYVLAPARSAALAERFLDRFLPARKPSAAAYEVPQHAHHPEIIFTDVRELLRCCEARPRMRHAAYWTHGRQDGEPRAAHVFFLSDGGMILGLSTAVREPVHCEWLLGELRSFTGAEVGLIALETPPPDSAAEFRRLAGGTHEHR
jgi:hypothetical protein